jgi:hypothetical protein
MAHMRTKRQTTSTLPISLSGLTPLELARKIPLADAARFNNVHIDTFKKNFPHLIRKIGKRRLAVVLYDALVLPARSDTS